MSNIKNRTINYLLYQNIFQNTFLFVNLVFSKFFFIDLLFFQQTNKLFLVICIFWLYFSWLNFFEKKSGQDYGFIFINFWVKDKEEGTIFILNKKSRIIAQAFSLKTYNE